MRLSIQTLMVLRSLELLRQQGESLYGLNVIKKCGLKSGVVYPILSRLEQNGHLIRIDESTKSARARNRPPRAYYEFTPAGEKLLRDTRSRLKELDNQLDGLK